jgi:hypothetical protein
VKLTYIAALVYLLLVTASLAPAQMLGEPAIISRDYVQDELKLSDDQKQKLQKSLLPDAPEKVWELVMGTLDKTQFERFKQLELQHEGPPALFRPEIASTLQITDEQRKQFIVLIQALQKTIEPLMKEAKAGGNQEEIRLKVIKQREDCQGKMEALMTDAQKKQWHELTGEPFDTLRHH